MIHQIKKMAIACVLYIDVLLTKAILKILSKLERCL